jgi:hypothetical protein
LRRESESSEPFERPRDLLTVGMAQNVEIACEPGGTMVSNGLPPDDQELNALFVQ